MHKFFTLMFGVFSLYGMLFASDVTTLDEAKALSAKENKPILLDFWTDN